MTIYLIEISLIMHSITYENIFDTITDSAAEASELQLRSDLMIITRDIINNQSSPSEITANKLRLTPTQATDIMSGRIEKFSTNLLFKILFRFGFRFNISYKNNHLFVKTLRLD